MRNCFWLPTNCSMWIDTNCCLPATAGRLLTRREALGRMCAGFGALGMAFLLGPSHALAALRQPHFAPRAKRVIFLFLNGGPSHIDTFDPKPALAKHEGEQPTGNLYKKTKGSGFMPSPFDFAPRGQSGIEVSEIASRAGRHHRRLLRHSLDAHRRAESRARPAANALGQRATHSAFARLVGALRTGHGKREPARLRRPAPEPEDRRWPGAVEQRVPAR